MASNTRRLVVMIALLWERPREVNYLAEILGVSERTVYRYLKEIEEDLEMPIEKDFERSRYFLVRGDKKSPLDFLIY
jgi:predicted DNA-binding transcriptional regulator YafY